MIISSFNRYFEKHGRKTYIVLGIIISVIFVFSLGGGMDSCGYREPGLKSFGKMYGKTLKSKETMELMRRADVGYVLRTGMSLGRNNSVWNSPGARRCCCLAKGFGGTAR